MMGNVIQLHITNVSKASFFFNPILTNSSPDGSRCGHHLYPRHGGTQMWSPFVLKAWWHSDVATTCTQHMVALRCGHHLQMWPPLVAKALWHSDVVTTCTQGMVALRCGHHLYPRHSGTPQWSPLVPKAWWHSAVITTCT